MSKSKLPKAKYQGEVDLNGFKLSCAVLEDGTRIFSERSLALAFGIRGGGAYYKRKKKGENVSAVLPEYLSAKYLKPFISNDLSQKFISAVSYEALNGIVSNGVEVTILPDICDVYVTAKNQGVTNDNFLKVADAAYTMIKAFAKVGIIALVDEATGYQYDREKLELQAILKLFISPEILEWKITFYLGFYKELFRLWNIPFTEKNIKHKPSFIGSLTNEFVYKNLPKGSYVLEKLKEKTPKTSGGNWRYNLHRSLTPYGKEELKKVISTVESLANISETKSQFKRLLQNRYGQRELPFTNLDELDRLAEKNEQKEMPQTKFDANLKGLLAVPKPPKENK